MKRNIRIVFSLILCVFAVCGCDFLRSVAGRPTSAVIEQKKHIIAEQEKAIADSIAAADSLRVIEETLEETKNLENPKFGIVLGSFKEVQNAERLLKCAEEAGYSGRIFLYKGLSAVLVCPTDDREEVAKSLELVSKEPFCPESAWIYAAK